MNAPNIRPDIRFVWLNVHGGTFHKLIRLHERLRDSGLSCEVLFSVGPPRGLKLGVDVPLERVPELAARGVHFLGRTEVLNRAEKSPARLTVTDAHHDPDLPRLVRGLRARGHITAQMATLLGDFCHHGAEHLLMQHPLTLFFEMDYNHTPEGRGFAQAKTIQFTGNIFFEPTANRLVNDYPDREAFCARYGFDPARPLCLWLPNSCDARSETYGQVIEAVRGAGANLVVKLHPWEYAFKKHGGEHPWGLAATTDVLWSVQAVDETDGTWAYRFCDVAMVRGSATILELPFLEKPCVMLPLKEHVALFRAQANLVRTCCAALSDMRDLPPLLKNGPPAYSPQDYEAGRKSVRIDTTRDAYEQTMDALRQILSAPEELPVFGSLAPLRRMADPFVDASLIRTLTPSRRLRYLAARALRGICG
ncbi:hypothetical protein [Humidesulfovibrio sp.]